MIGTFIQQYGMTILYTVLTAIAGFIGLQIKNIYEKHSAEEEKKKVVETCVKAVEQLYKDLSGEEKKEKAIENITAMLDAKGITIAPIEIDMLIEATVASFNNSFNSTTTFTYDVTNVTTESERQHE